MMARPKDAVHIFAPRCFAADWRRTETEAGPIFSHGGSLAGTSTLLVRRPDSRNWVVLFNTRNSPHTFGPASAFEREMTSVLDSIERWHAHDLFSDF